MIMDSQHKIVVGVLDTRRLYVHWRSDWVGDKWDCDGKWLIEHPEKERDSMENRRIMEGKWRIDGLYLIVSLCLSK